RLQNPPALYEDIPRAGECGNGSAELPFASEIRHTPSSSLRLDAHPTCMEQRNCLREVFLSCHCRPVFPGAMAKVEKNPRALAINVEAFGERQQGSQEPLGARDLVVLVQEPDLEHACLESAEVIPFCL